MCCFKCCLWCLEKFIKFLNRNAYIMVSPCTQPRLLAPRPPRRPRGAPGDPDLPLPPRSPSTGRISASPPGPPSCCSCGTWSGQAAPRGLRAPGLRGARGDPWPMPPAREAAPSSRPLPRRVVVLDKVTDLLLLFGKLLVVGGVGKTGRAASTGRAGGRAGSGELAPVTPPSRRGPVLLPLHGSPGAGPRLGDPPAQLLLAAHHGEWPPPGRTP